MPPFSEGEATKDQILNAQFAKSNSQVWKMKSWRWSYTAPAELLEKPYTELTWQTLSDVEFRTCSLKNFKHIIGSLRLAPRY